ncbi:MAG: PKD domain-containing protein [Candidatus Aminicenantes bacterium]|jgi:PKD repeat protein
MMQLKNNIRIMSVICFIFMVFTTYLPADLASDGLSFNCTNQGDLTINIGIPEGHNIHKVILAITITPDSVVLPTTTFSITGPDVPGGHTLVVNPFDDFDTNPGVGNEGIGKKIRLSSTSPGVYYLIIRQKPTDVPRGTVNGGTGSEAWIFSISGLDTSVSNSIDGSIVSQDGNFAPLALPDAATITSDPCPGNSQPTAFFTVDADNGPAPLSVNFNATGSSDSDGTVDEYQWTFGDGDTDSTTVPNTSHEYITASVTPYDAVLVVVDDDGASSSAFTYPITVTTPTNQPPIASFTIDLVSGHGPAPLTVNFDAFASNDPDGSIDRYIWDFNDGTTLEKLSTEPDPHLASNIYETPGTYTVTLIVRDNEGLDCVTPATVNITVDPPVKEPKEVMLVVDHSGSMTGNKWSTTVTAANTFVNLLYQLNEAFTDPEKDKIGVVSYTSSTGWNFGVSHADLIEIRPPGVPPVGINLDSVFAGQVFDMTPTGEGLMEAIGEFESLESPDGTGNEKYILLLTDGENNAGYYTIDDFRDAFQGHANEQINDLKVYSVVIGDDTYIWPERIAELSVVDSAGEYRVTDDPVVLPQFFAQILGDIVVAEEIPANTSPEEHCPGAIVGSYCMGAEPKVAFIATWDRSDGGPYYLRATGGSLLQEINPVNLDSYINVKKSFTLPTDSYTFYILEETTDVPGSGEQKAQMDGFWTLTLVDDTNHTVSVPSAEFFVLHDLKVRTHFGIDRKKHGTGDSIIFTAEIKEFDQPVLNADVKVKIKRPGEGAGELMYKTPPPSLSTSREAKEEGLSPIFLHMKEVFKALGRDYLLSLDDEVTLLDNGTGEDEVAEDGIYTGVFSNLRYEGNYTFKFTAKGTTPQNRTFARTKTISQFVKVNVAPDLSKLKYWVNPKILDGLIREVWVLYEPVDRFGSHLGPYRSDYLKYEFTGGEPQDKIEYNSDQEDKKGGKYYQRILFNDRKQLPRVRVKYQESPIGKQLTLRTFHRFEISIHGGLFANYRISEEQEVKFDSTSPIYRLRLAYNPRKAFGFEANVGLTPTANQLGDRGRFIQCGVNVFYNLQEAKFSSYRLTPFLTMGVGAFLYRGFDEDDESFAWNIGGGFKYSLGNGFDLMYDIRHFMSFGTYGSKTRNHLQTTAGIAFSLK